MIGRLLLALFVGAASAGAASATDGGPPGPAEAVRVQAEVAAEPRVEGVRRIGINLGHWTYWGAEQLSRNVLKNPGFEGLIDRALVRVAHTERYRFSDDQAWLARDDGFWIGAGWEVLTGAASGAQGAILDSRATGDDGLPEFVTAGLPGDLAVGDIVALTRIRDDLPPTHWWLPQSDHGRVRVDTALRAPDSPGRRSLALEPLPGATLRLTSYLDTIGQRAGKLLPVAGPWRLALWLHGAEGDEASVRILFRRHGTAAPFADLTVRPTPGWQRIEQDFQAQDEGPAGTLEFAVEVTGTGPVHIDDVWLGPWPADGDAPAAFRPEVIAALTALRPGYLRDWQGQLGDTLDNRLADPRARRASRYRPAEGAEFGYGLPEFLALCRAVGADPWIVMPTTFSPEEARRLGAWLAERIARDGFDEVLVEFGNENWNALFRPAGIQDPAHHGAAADRLFAALRAGADDHRALRLVVNAQHANPWSAGKVATAAAQADLIAVAPYLLPRLDADAGRRALEQLFADDGGRLAQIAAALPTGKELAVYEVNLHTTRGDAPAAGRNALVSGAASGPALAKRLLEALALGARRQCVYTLAGYDTPLDGQASLVPLFGVTRDLAGDLRLRPSGLATALLNRVIDGDLHAVAGAPPDLLIAPFRSPHGWSAAVVSSAATARRLTLRFPNDATPRPSQGLVLDASDPWASNEETQTVAPRPLAVRTAGRAIEVEIPPHSLAVLSAAEVPR